MGTRRLCLETIEEEPRLQRDAKIPTSMTKTVFSRIKNITFKRMYEAKMSGEKSYDFWMGKTMPVILLNFTMWALSYQRSSLTRSAAQKLGARVLGII